MLFLLFCFQIRKGVLEVSEMNHDKTSLCNKTGVKPWMVKVSTTSNIWRDILCKETSTLSASMKGNLLCEPGIRQLGIFMDYFDRPSG